VYHNKSKLIILTLSFFFYGISCQNSDSDNSKDQKIQIQNDVKNAFRLEEQLWTNKSQFKTRQQVYHHYRQGFSDELAESLTSYSWTDGELRATEKTMEVPDTIFILSLSKDYAEVYFVIPSDLRNIWQLKKYSINYLRNENDKWIIYESKESDSIPTSISN